MQLQPDKVKRSWDKNIKIGKLPSKSLPKGTNILNVFERKDIHGSLLILGEPGSGKTTMTLDLVQSLIQKAELDKDFPIPVLFDLASWSNEYSSLEDWLVTELYSLSTKISIRKDITKKWIEEKELLPILDSLDELKPEQQVLCIQSINQFLRSKFCPLHIVVCSRNEEYKNCSEKLELSNAVHINDLTDLKIQEYLKSVNRIELWKTFKEDEALLDLVRKPLMLYVTVQSYEELSIEDWQKTTSLETRRTLLWDSYIRRMLNRDLKNLSYRNNEVLNIEETQKWISFLAQRLQNESQSEFLIEKMQPLWLISEAQTQNYSLLLILFNFFIVFVISFIAFQYSNLGYRVLVITIGIATFFWSIIKRYNIDIIERISFSLATILSAIIGGFKSYLSFLPTQISLLFIFFISWQRAFIVFLSSGLAWSMIYFIFKIQYLELEKKEFANQGIKKTVFNWVGCSLLFGLLIASIKVIMFDREYLSYLIGIAPFDGMIASQSLAESCFPNPITSIAIGTQFSFAFIGRACVQHLTLRLILFFNNIIPWNYARFLDYCQELLFLQRIGGRYRFIHKSLQEHFANITLEDKSH